MPTFKEKLFRQRPIATALNAQDFSRLAADTFFGLRDDLVVNGSKYNLSVFEKWFTDFSKDREHGIDHSRFVFERAKQIRNAEGLHAIIGDEDLFIRAFFHDAGQFFTNKNTNLASSSHQYTMAGIVEYIGQVLNISDANQLMVDILHHDDYWQKPDRQGMTKLGAVLSPAGQIIADADRLVFDTENAIDRNRSGSLGRWHFFRPDQTTEDRLQWRMRTKGLFDGFCALLTEFSGPEFWFYTSTGKQMNKERKLMFRDAVKEYYRKQFIDSWLLVSDAVKYGQPIEFGTRGNNNVLIPIDEKDKTMMADFDRLPFYEKIQLLLKTPISAKRSVDGRDFIGYSIRIGGENGQWVDPSILRFTGADKLMQALDAEIDEFQSGLEKRYG